MPKLVMGLVRLVVVGGLAVVGGSVYAAPPDGNLLANPGFEELAPETGFAATWQPTYWSNPHGKVEASSEARTGARSVVVTGVPLNTITDAAPRNNNLIAQALTPPLVGRRKLRFEAWCRAAPNAIAYLSIITRDANGKQLQYVSSPRLSGQADWTPLALSISTEPETAQLTVYLRNDGEGPARYDDASLRSSDDVLENDWLRVHVEPLIGGRLHVVFDKTHGRDLTLWNGVRPGGLAAEIVPGDEYPGALRDGVCQIETLVPHRRVRLTHGPMAEPRDGLVVEKEVCLRDDVPVVEVRLRVTNRATAARTLNLRAQQCLPPGPRLITAPVGNGLRVIRPQADLLKWGLELTGFSAGWIACSELESAGGVLFRFDRESTAKAYLYSSADVQTVEWYYAPVTLPAGGTWETTYAIAVLPTNTPVVAASDDIALGLAPLALGGVGAYGLHLSPLRPGVQAHLSAQASGTTPLAGVTAEVAVALPGGAAVPLPWAAQSVQRIDLAVRVESTDLAVQVAAATLDDGPLSNLPPPERLGEFPAATTFFPYAEYYRGIVGAEAGSALEQTRRHLRAYRRCYLNTYMVGETALLGPFHGTGTSPLGDLVRQHRMRLIPRADMMRRFERNEAGVERELPPPLAVTREVALARVEYSAATSLAARQSFLKAYGDLILAYDFADEPGSEYIPLYLMLQSVYRQIDPAHPVLVILNLNRTEFLPFMPIYYGDEYPVRNAKNGGRNPWGVSTMVRSCATRTQAPVWVMLQAFGGLADYTWQLPNQAEMRLMLYETIANGAKGITFHGSCSPPCWRYNGYYVHTAMDSWLAETPAWEAMREAGQYITAIGPALLTAAVSDEQILSLDCEPIGSAATPYRGPAVKAGVLKRGEGGWFAVVVNQDIDTERAATLSVRAESTDAETVLCDLHSLTPLGPAASARHHLSLAPGDGRVFFVGTPAQTAAVVATVQQGHYNNALPLYEIDAALARVHGCDLASAAAHAGTAAQAGRAGHWRQAREEIGAARQAVSVAIAGHPALSAALAGLTEAHRLLSEVAAVYREHPAVVVPSAVAQTTPKDKPFNNRQDATLQQYVDQTAQAFCLRLKLEDRLYAGAAAQLVTDLEALTATARRLHGDAIPYVRAKAAAK